LLDHNAGLDLLHRARLQIAELERPERHPDQPVHRKPHMLQDAANFAILPLAQRHADPDISAFAVAVELRLNRTIANAVDLDALAQFIQRLLADPPTGARPVTPRPAGGRGFQMAGKLAIVGEQKQAFAVEVEAPHRDDARHFLWQRLEHSGPSLGIAMGRHSALWLVVAPKARRLGRRQWRAVHRNDIFRADINGRPFNTFAV
jgi:hypothetical protein